MSYHYPLPYKYIMESDIMPTLKNMLLCGLTPIGKCLYVFGGGWNDENTAAGTKAKTIGLSKSWESFYNKNDSSYDYEKTKYRIHDGLDCTGYLGWLMYQIFGDTYSDNGYVFPSAQTAEKYAEIFGGKVIPKEKLTHRQCGDIMCKDGHVYITVGECSDGSIVILHASPPSVSLCGTAAYENRNSAAIRLAKQYMQAYFPKCIEKYPNYARNSAYLTEYDAVRWNGDILQDPDGYRKMSAEDILADLFKYV